MPKRMAVSATPRSLFVDAYAKLSVGFRLGRGTNTQGDFGEGARQIARVEINGQALVGYVYDRIHDKSSPVTRELTDDEARLRKVALELPDDAQSKALMFETTAADQAAETTAVLLPGALRYNLEVAFAFTLRSCEQIARCVALGNTVDHAKLLSGVERELREGLTALHRKAGAPKGSRVKPVEALMLSLFYDFKESGESKKAYSDNRAAREVQKDARMKRILPQGLRDPLKKIRRAERRAKSLGLSRTQLKHLADGKL